LKSFNGNNAIGFKVVYLTMVYVLTKKFRFTVMLKDICIPSARVSINDIISVGSLKEFIEEHVEKYHILPTTAIQVFSRGKLQGLSEAIRILRSLTVFDVEVYFITPIGLLWEDEPLIPYAGCLDDISIESMKRLFRIFNTEDAIYDIIETQPDFLYLYVNTKLIKLLDLINYIPRDTLTILVSDTGLIANRENIRAIYPSSSLITIFKKYGLKISSENFPGTFLLYLSRFLYKLSFEMNTEKFIEYLLKVKSDPKDFLSIITSPEALIFVEKAKDQSILKFIRFSEDDSHGGKRANR